MVLVLADRLASKSDGPRRFTDCRSRPRCDMIDSMNRPDLDDFRRQCVRQLARPVSARIRYGFFRNPNPVRDSNKNLAFGSMSEYRKFCEDSYPEYFGYARPGPATLRSLSDSGRTNS